LRKGEDTTRELCSLPSFDPQSPESYTRYFELFYRKVNDTGEAFLKILKPSTSPSLLDVAFRSADNQFHLIDDRAQRAVLVRYGKSDPLLKTLQHAGPNRELLRKLQRYTVNLRVETAERMQSDGLLEELWPGFIAQCEFSLYDETIGLNVFKETLNPEDLVL